LEEQTRRVSALTPADWHRRFLEQATWTSDIRRHLYTRAGLKHARRILEAGCGTGVIAAELSQYTRARVTGLDLRGERLRLARENANRARFIQGDAFKLPFAQASFDITLCHFLLLWLPEPQQALVEMARVTRPGGAVLALAEPDYGGRIDYPLELAAVGRLQAEALRRQGADPETGRKLAALLCGAGLQEVETGVLGGEWQGQATRQVGSSEWAVLADDLQDLLPEPELSRLQQIDLAARQSGERILFVPTFYGWGRVSR
jgi:SAM-dependent methyltransferase